MSWRGNWKMWRTWVAAAAGFAVAGCSNNNAPEQPEAIQESVALTAFSGANACSDLETYFEDTAVTMMRTQIEGERDNVPQWGWWGGAPGGFGFGLTDAATPTAGAQDNAKAAPTNYTTTNTQVAGVDEADFVKNDGTRIFVLSGNKLYATLSWPASELAIQGKLVIEGWPQEMFLTDDSKVVVFSNVWQALPLDPTSGLNCKGLDCGYYYANSAKVTVIDATNLANLSVTAEYYLPGSYNSSRRIGDSVRIVMSDSMHYPIGMQWWPSNVDFSTCGWSGATCSASDKAKHDAAFNDLIATNTALIRGTTLAEWLPAGRLVQNGKTTILPPDCSSFSKVNAPVRMGQLIVATLDLKNPGSITRNNILAETGQVYASANNLYVATRHWWWWPQPGQKDVTYIHKFDITQPDKAVYVASGTAPGSILDQFSMDENDQGFFRMATVLSNRVVDTTNPDNWFGTVETSNQVTVLSENAGVLNVVGQSAELAKGEQLQSSRFIGNKAYVTTFLNTDPLFTFDMTDPTNPKQVGSLVVPGTTSYIQGLDDNHIITMGEFIPPDAPDDWQGRRVQIAIYDVSNLQNPQQTFVQTIGDSYSYSEAEYDHKAFNYFAAMKLLAVPFSSYNSGVTNGDYWSTFTSDLRVFTVDANTGFVPMGALSMHDLYQSANYWGWTYYWQPEVSRSVMADNFVYAISDAGLRVAMVSSLGTPIATVQFDRYEDNY